MTRASAVGHHSSRNPGLVAEPLLDAKHMILSSAHRIGLLIFLLLLPPITYGVAAWLLL